MSEASAVAALVSAYADHPYVLDRMKWNDAAAASLPNPAEFWKQLVLALASSRQPNRPGSALHRLENEEPFRLTLAAYWAMTDGEVTAALNGLHYAKPITRYLRRDYDWLFGKSCGWDSVEARLKLLVDQRNSASSAAQKTSEREMAHYLANSLIGVGPKQSRNLLQDLGLTRYEIPVDSRMVGWLKNRLGWNICMEALSKAEYYDDLLDRVQATCAEAGVLPTLFDAAVYEEMGKTTPTKANPTTLTGFVNRNGQVVIRNTRLPGTDKNQYVYQLGCSHCGEVYGANGSDIHLRLCPNCQDGAAGLSIAKFS